MINGHLRFRRLLQNVRSPLISLRWVISGWASPAPSYVKRSVLKRYSNPEDSWVETGTYFGATTAFLSRRAVRIFTIEPEPQLAALAEERFRKKKNVTVLNGTSEQKFRETLEHLQGPVAVWLDGHFSAGVTFKGDSETPIKHELEVLEQKIQDFTRLTVFVDDFRSFADSSLADGTYPPRADLVRWAERVGLGWTVEHDIFVAWKRP